MKKQDLQEKTVVELHEMASKKGIVGHSSMNKDELVDALSNGGSGGGGQQFESTRPLTFVPDKDDPTKAVQTGPQKPDMTGYEGSYKLKSLPDDAPKFGLKVVEEGSDENYGHTHFLRSEEHSWSGSEKDFKDQFEEA